MLQRGGLDDLLGEDGVVPAGDKLFGPLETAVARARAWIAAQPKPDDSEPDDPFFST